MDLQYKISEALKKQGGVIIMNKWDIYKSFNYWKDQKISELQREYESGKNCGDSMRSTDDISFEDFCVGKWQRL